MKRLLSVLSAVLLLAFIAWAWRVEPYRDPDSALSEFLAMHAQAEEQLIDPLVLAGPEVVPLVIQGLEQRSIAGRPWAAAFLGNGGYADAAPVLAELAADEAEQSQTRRYALRALALVNREQASALAQSLLNTPGGVGEAASAVLASDDSLTYRRSYVAALAGWRR